MSPVPSSALTRKVKLAPFNSDQLDLGAHAHADRSRRYMRDVDVGADRMFAFLQVTAQTFNASCFKRGHQEGCGENRRHIAEGGETLGHLGNCQIQCHRQVCFVSEAQNKRWLRQVIPHAE